MALSTPTDTDNPISPTDRPLTRRERRAAEARGLAPVVRSSAPDSRGNAPEPRVARPSARTAPASAIPSERPSRWKQWRSRLVMMIVVPGLCAAFALPGNFAPSSQAAPLGATDTDRTAGAQQLNVSTAAAVSPISRDTYSATTTEQLAEAEAAAAAEAAAERAAAAERSGSQNTGATGPVAPPATSYSLSAVFNTAKQYIGTPYVYGGATPAGFDCSGFVMYVFAQYGISLPHGVSGQAAAGTRIPTSQAQPGDIVIMSGHDGFYAGNGMILDAPKPGGHVSIRPLWTSNYYIVRI